MRDWVRQDDRVQFVIVAVEQMDLSMVEQAGATVYCSMGQQREYHQPRYDFKPPIRNLSFASTTQTPIFSL